MTNINYEALVKEARKAQRAVYLAAAAPVAEDLSRIIKGLANAVEALSEDRDGWLDSMTTEWSAPDTGSVETTPFPFGYGGDETLARRTAATLQGPVYKRVVGPWVATV